MPKETEPTPLDDAETAMEKSGTIEERVPAADPVSAPSEALVAGAPATYMPQMGTGLPQRLSEDAGPGEAVLDQESKATKAKIQRG